jgi:hypothetical protein
MLLQEGDIMTTTRLEDFATNKTYNVGARMGSYRIETINVQDNGSLRSLGLSYCKKDGTPDKRRKTKYFFPWNLKEVN